MEEKVKNSRVIDLRVIASSIKAAKPLYLKVLLSVFVLSCIYIFSLPRYYTADIKLAPEMESSTAGGALSSLASSFGFDLGDMQTTDAITPLLYPDLLDDNGFVYSLMSIKVESQDGEISVNYHDYLAKHQKYAWWQYPINWISMKFSKKDDSVDGRRKFDPYVLTRKENGLYNIARGNITIGVDKKTGVISISTKAQDALVAKTLADSIKEKLQVFITDYRTNKARIDYDYYEKLTKDARSDYEHALKLYASTSDANTNAVLRSMQMKIEDLETDMQLKMNAYGTINNQLQAAKAKVQERTPAFTVIKGADVPVKPAGPKRILFVLAMMVIATIGTTVMVCRKYLATFL